MTSEIPGKQIYRYIYTTNGNYMADIVSKAYWDT